MSIPQIPYPPQSDHTAAWQEERRRRALQSLEPGDVLAAVDDVIASEPDPAKHPFYHLVVWLLDRELTPLNGGQLFDTCRQLCADAVNHCVDDALQRGDD